MVRLQAVLIVIYHCLQSLQIDTIAQQIKGHTQVSLPKPNTQHSLTKLNRHGFFLRSEHICRAAAHKP